MAFVFCYTAPDVCRIDIQGFRLHVCENDFDTHIEEGNVRRRAGEQWRDHFIAGLQTRQYIGKVQRIRAGAHGERKSMTRKRCSELSFEFFYERALADPSRVQQL